MPTPNHSEENVIKCPQAHSEAISKRLEFKRECTCLPNKKANQPRPRLTAPQLDCYDETAGWSSLVARWAHNPKVGGSNPPPATNFINHLAGFTDFHLGQIRVTNSRYCTEVVIVGHSTQTSFSGFQPSCSALFFTKSTKRRCNSRLASICGAPYTWEVVAMFSCRSRVFTSSSVNPASLPQALTVCRKLCQPIFGRPALTATGCT